MHRYLFCMILLYKLLPSDAVSCSYPRLSETCEKIASSEESDWNKVYEWKTVLSSIDLSHIYCDEDIAQNSQKLLMKVTSASDYSPFEFKFTGSVDENKKFAGQGIYWEVYMKTLHFLFRTVFIYSFHCLYEEQIMDSRNTKLISNFCKRSS